LTRERGSPFGRVRRMAAETPPERDRHIDLMRALAIGAVVLGHWLVFAVREQDGRPGGQSVLADLDWAHPVTWLFQVMPIIFLVGGYANAASFESHRRRGGDWTSWLLGRSRRLLGPTTLLLGVLAATGLVANTAGAEAEDVGLGVWAASLPLWFLAAYLAMVLFAPLTLRLHRRWGLAVPVVLAVLVAVLDAVQFGLVPGTADGPWPEAKYLLAWLAVHQVGYCWRDGLLPGRPLATAALAAGGLACAVLLVAFGPYPVSMVAVPEAVSNTGPPTLALLALALAQTGLVLLVAEPARRWLRGIGVWTAVVAVNTVVLTIFLWHMGAAVLGALLLYPTGLMPDPDPTTALWLLLRLPWIAVLAVILFVLLTFFGGAEVRAAGRAPLTAPSRRPPVVALVPAGLVPAGLGAAVLGLVGIALSGPLDLAPAGLPTLPLVCYALGAAVLRLLHMWAE
jgi:fucose 4-O-acetylase-like acetyltransferase